MLEIWTKRDEDIPWAEAVLGSAHLPLEPRRIPEIARLPGYVAMWSDRRAGLVTYCCSGPECRIVVLVATTRRSGVGSALLREVVHTARAKCCERLSIVATDEPGSLRFLHQHGFSPIHDDAEIEVEWRNGKPQTPTRIAPERPGMKWEMLLDGYHFRRALYAGWAPLEPFRLR